jgi:hypothetical protein
MNVARTPSSKIISTTSPVRAETKGTLFSNEAVKFLFEWRFDELPVQLGIVRAVHFERSPLLS